MEIDEVDDDDVTDTGICNVGGSGDEGGKESELFLKLRQYVTSDANFTRWVSFFHLSPVTDNNTIVNLLVNLSRY